MNSNNHSLTNNPSLTNSVTGKKPSLETRIVDRNIQALLSRRMQEDKHKNWQDHVAKQVTRFTGSMRFV
jgi:uncharacterized membrane protein